MPDTIYNTASVCGPPGSAADPNSPAAPAEPGNLSQTNSSKLVETSAMSAFDAYYAEANSRYNLPYPSSYEGCPDWPTFVQVAVLCVTRGWDADDFVRKAMGSLPGHHRCILPKDLLKPAMAKAYAVHLARSELVRVGIVDEYKRCVELLIQREMDGGDERPLLLSPSTAFPAWFRVCYPESIDIDIVNAWGETAKRELSGSPKLMALVRALDPGKWERIKRALWFYDDPEGKEGKDDCR